MDFDDQGNLFAEGEGEVSPMMALLMGRVGARLQRKKEEDAAAEAGKKEKEKKDLKDSEAALGDSQVMDSMS